MPTHLKSVKIWIFVVLCSVFVYNLYYLIHGLQFTWWTYTVLGGPALYYYRTISSIGHTLRFIGLFLALQAAYPVWGPKAKPFSAVKNRVSAALFLEAAYYITFVPGLLNIMDFGRFLPEMTFFASIYFLQMLLIMPFLTILDSQNKERNGDRFTEVGGAGLRRLHRSQMGQHYLQVILQEFLRVDSIYFNRNY